MATTNLPVGLAQAVAFITEIEKLKGIVRQTRPQGLERRENSAEHSWHLALAAIALAPHATEPVDLPKVIRMVLVHDLGEIDADDVVVYRADTVARHAQEQAGIERVLGMLPDETSGDLIALWHEFEKGETAEARFARAIDRLPPVLQNLADGGYSWRNNAITYEQVVTVNARIAGVSPELWEGIRARIDEAKAAGVFDAAR